ATRERQPLDRTREQAVGTAGSPQLAFAEADARREHALAHRRRPLGRRTSQRIAARARNGQEQVEAVEQRPRQPLAVALRSLGGARADRGPVAACAARAEVHRTDELKARREDGTP